MTSELTTTSNRSDTREARIDLRDLFEGLLSSRGIRMDAKGVRMWLDAFADLSPDEVSTAIRRFNREADPKQFPSPSAVRQFAGVRGLGDGNRSALAWAAVLRAARSIGIWRSVDFDDRIINAVIHDLRGWVPFVESLDDPATLPFREKDFRDRYHAISISGIGDGRPLFGTLELQQRRDGLDFERVQREAERRYGDKIPERVQRRIGFLRDNQTPQVVATGLTPHPIAKRLTTLQAACLASLYDATSDAIASIGRI